MGCPNETLPPFTLTLKGSSLSVFSTATVEPLKASLISKRSTSSMVIPSFFKHLGMAQIGATRIYFRSIPYDAWAPMVAIISQPNSSALSLDMTTTAAAPSLMMDAFPAVPFPSFLNAGFIFDKCSYVVSRGHSSSSKRTGSPFRWGISTGTISSLNRPARMASRARP